MDCDCGEPICKHGRCRECDGCRECSRREEQEREADLIVAYNDRMAILMGFTEEDFK